jgi:hypothetical protein
MSFQSYLKNIEAATGWDAAAFREFAEKKKFTNKGVLNPAVKAGEIVQWLKDDFSLGHGHAMAIFALLKGTKDENSK